MNEEIAALTGEWEDHKELPFPQAPAEGSPFKDLYPQLVAFDGYVTGLVSSTLNGKIADKNEINRALFRVNDFFVSLNEVQPQDAAMDKERSRINDRVESLHRLVEDLLVVVYSP
jgi:hypothetical protein